MPFFQKNKLTLSWKQKLKLATVTGEATRLFQHCNITSRAGLTPSPLLKNYDQWKRLNKSTVSCILGAVLFFFLHIFFFF